MLNLVKSENKIPSKAIDMIALNCKENCYIRTHLYQSSPVIFAKALLKENRGKNIIFGNLDRPNIPFTKNNNI